MRRLFISIALASVAGLLAAMPTGGGTGQSGLHGLVLEGPNAPICIREPCWGPAPGVMLAFSQNGRVVARVTTNRKGQYRLSLRPGSYAVRTPRERFTKVPAPARARVPRGRVARVGFKIDSGIQ